VGSEAAGLCADPKDPEDVLDSGDSVADAEQGIEQDGAGGTRSRSDWQNEVSFEGWSFEHLRLLFTASGCVYIGNSANYAGKKLTHIAFEEADACVAVVANRTNSPRPYMGELEAATRFFDHQLVWKLVDGAWRKEPLYPYDNSPPSGAGVPHFLASLPHASRDYI